jgi:hypothetical protein
VCGVGVEAAERDRGRDPLAAVTASGAGAPRPQGSATKSRTMMTPSGRDERVLVIDGSQFDDYWGFNREFSRLLDGHEWHENLNAFDEVLRGGLGTPVGGFVLRWISSDPSSDVPGYPARCDCSRND